MIASPAAPADPSGTVIWPSVTAATALFNAGKNNQRSSGENQMSRMLIIVGVFSAFAFGHALAQNNATSPVCYNDKMLNNNGSLIRTGSGLIFKAYPGSNGKLSSWLPLDVIRICRIGGIAVEITNLSRKDQQVKAVRQFN